MTLGTIIQKKRLECGLSQEQLAEQVGVSRQAVSKWEVGDAIPDTDKLIPLARALGITVDELLGNSPREGRFVSESIAAAADPKKEPGWFALHWYWLGLIPVIWGVIQVVILLVIVLSFTGLGVTGGSELVAGAVETVIG